MINVNDFKCLTDNETLELAIANKQADGIVVIPPRVSDIEPERTYWLLDRAILLPENTTVVLQNCTIKLSDRCRDNFFRSANCGMGIEFPERIKNIHIRGEGLCTLLGADHPRASGDGTKVIANPCPYLAEDLVKYADWVPEERRSVDKLNFWDFHDRSYGTDAGKEDQSQYGDWRGIGILLANVEDFSISNLRIVEPHGWSISLEECAKGRVEKIDFDSCMSKVIDGMVSNMENQDGINLRNGCHHIIISDITGHTGDDVIALTAFGNNSKGYIPGGSLRTTHVMHNDWTKRDKNIHDVIIRNVAAYSQLNHIVSLLAVDTHIWNIVVDGVIDTAPEGNRHIGVLGLSTSYCYDEANISTLEYGISDITVSNIICANGRAVGICKNAKDCVFTNIVSRDPENPAVRLPDGVLPDHIQISNVVAASGTPIL